jgi:predicted Mrr-cat superfamily restriction endonuclease
VTAAWLVRVIGRVTGGYEYRDPSPAGDYHHVRSVRWLRRWPRDQIAEELLAELRYRRTIRQLTHQQEWAAIVDRLVTADD